MYMANGEGFATRWYIYVIYVHERNCFSGFSAVDGQ